MDAALELGINFFDTANGLIQNHYEIQNPDWCTTLYTSQ
jgi:aryl-alcohol dehydrogenase-like predicted oxidoreductase